MSYSNTKVNSEQKTILFDAMCRNRHILEKRNAVEWVELVAHLNAHGEAKDINQWKKCWRDLRAFIRKKYLQKKRYKKEKYILDDYQRLVIRACGMQFIEGEEGELQSAIDEKEQVEDVEDFQVQVKQEQPDEPVTNTFDGAGVPSEEITSDQELVRDSIKVEETQLHICPSELMSESADFIFASSESLNEECNSHVYTSNNLNTTASKESQNDAVTEIRKMHRNLLRESKKQTALLRQLLNRLTD